MTSRRQLLGAIVAAASLGKAVPPTHAAQAQPAPQGPFALPPLPYPYDALEPYIDAQTMQIHHSRHHAAYVDNLNRALAQHPELGKRSVEELLRDLDALPPDIRTAVRNHGGGHANHTLFWQAMSKDGARRPLGELAKAIDVRFGSFGAFQEQLTRAATGVFGSGWAWLAAGQNRQLEVMTTPNQDTPLSAGHTPLLLIDVWEHAYYLKHQNRRAEYVTAFHNVINWEAASERFSRLGR